MNAMLGYMKTCTACKVEKDDVRFSRWRKDGESRRAQCIQCCNASERERQKRPEVRAKINESARAYRKNAESKVRDYARWEVKWAVKEGRLVRGGCRDGCCGSCSGPIHAHHWSYAKEHWLDVVWLCHHHHVQEHRRLRGRTV